MIEPLSVGHHAYVRSGAKEGDVALVGGAGPIGLLLAAVLKAKGIKVIITELSKARKDKHAKPALPTTSSTRLKSMSSKK